MPLKLPNHRAADQVPPHGFTSPPYSFLGTTKCTA